MTNRSRFSPCRHHQDIQSRVDEGISADITDQYFRSVPSRKAGGHSLVAGTILAQLADGRSSMPDMDDSAMTGRYRVVHNVLERAMVMFP